MKSLRFEPSVKNIDGTAQAAASDTPPRMPDQETIKRYCQGGKIDILILKLINNQI